jgi:hypothetical protein
MRLSKVKILILFSIVFLALSSWGAKNEKAEGALKEQKELFIIEENGNYGYIDRTGKIAIEPQFDQAGNFSEGMAWIYDRVKDKYGYIDRTGRIIIEPQFGWVDDFFEGLAVVSTKRPPSEGEISFIDKTGKIVIGPLGEGWSFGGSHFSEGLAPVYHRDKGGFMNKRGEVVIEPQFEGVGDFSEGLADVKLGGKWGYIDKTGKVVIEAQFTSANSFSEGLARVWIGESPYYGGRGAYIDKKGIIVIKPQFILAEDFSEGLALVNIGDKCGYIDKTGKLVIEIDPSSCLGFAKSFSDGLACVVSPKDENGVIKGHYIDKTGKLVIELLANPFFDDPTEHFGDFKGGLAHVRMGNKWCYIDKTGKIIWEERKSKDIKDCIKIVDVETKWVAKDFQAYPPRLIIVPSISFRIKNVSGEALRKIDFTAIFRFVGEYKNLGDCFLATLEEFPLLPGELSDVITLKSNFGVEGKSADSIKNNPQWKVVVVEIFAQSECFGHTHLRTYEVSRKIDF